MPIASYKPALIPLVVSGKKTHTIRFPKRPWKIGDTIIHATGARTAAYKEHRRDTVTRVDDITIDVHKFGNSISFTITLLGKRLTAYQFEALARNDGFPDSSKFLHFFADTYGNGTHTGQLIHWAKKPLNYTRLRPR